MKIFVKNSYGGGICTIKFERESEKYFGMGFQIDGYIEGPNTKVNYLTSNQVFIEDSITFKIPSNAIPTFSKNKYRVHYECKCILLYEMEKTPFVFEVKIFNNNLQDFNFEKPIELNLDLKNSEKYNLIKEMVCKALLSEIKSENNRDAKDASVSLGDLNPEIEEKQNLKENQSDYLSSNKDIETLQEEFKDLNIRNEDKASNNDQSGTQEATIFHEIPCDYLNNEVDQTQKHINSGAFSPDISSTDAFIGQCREYVAPISPSIGIEDPSKGLNDDLDIEDSKKVHSLNSSETKDQNSSKSIDLSNIGEDLQIKLSSLIKTIVRPEFSCPSVLEVSKKYTTVDFMIENENAAIITYPSVIVKIFKLNMKYLRNIKRTKINIFREFYEESSLMTLESVYSINFDSDQCLCRDFQINLDGFSLNTQLFAVKYTMCIQLDSLELRIPLLISSSHVKIISNF